MPTDLRADEVKLRQYDETLTQTGSGLVVDVQRAAGVKNVYFYGWGVGLTNDLRNWQADTTVVGTNGPYPGLTAYYATYYSNRLEHGWSGTNLANGTHVESNRTVETNYNDYLEQVSVQDTNVVVTATNQSITFNDSPPWRGANFNYTETIDDYTISYGETCVSDVVLITSTNSDWSGKALFKLTAGVLNAQQEAITSGYKVAGKTPDTNGVVFKVYDDGTTNAVSPEITATNSITNYSFTITPQRVQLTKLEWWNPVTSTWTEGPVYVLTNTTVSFRVKSNPEQVDWPSTLPEWKCGNFNTQGVTSVQIPFTTLSTSTNGEKLIVTAGNSLTTKIVVYDFSIVAKGEDTAFSTAPRTSYGVGERMNFSIAYMPAGNLPLSFNWSGQGSANWTGFEVEDQSVFGADGGQFLHAGALPEGWTVTATLASGFNAGSSRSTNVSIIAPTSAILLAVSLPPIAPNPNVGHTQYTISCTKKAHYQLLPTSVSFAGIKLYEGVAPYEWQGATTNISAQAWYPNANGTNAWNNTTFSLPAISNHTQQGPWVFGHYSSANGLTPNVATDRDTFGVQPFSSFLPYAVMGGTNVCAAPSIAQTNLCRIPLLYQFNDKLILFATNNSTRIFGPQGAVTIEKGGISETKAFNSPTTPD